MGFHSMQHLSVHQVIVMCADNWKDFQVASVLLRIQIFKTLLSGET